MAESFKRNGSSALILFRRGSRSVSLTKSFSTESHNSAIAGEMRSEIDKSSAKRLINALRSLIACPRWRVKTFKVTSGVTKGLPSRSPPIHDPKVSGWLK